MSAPILLPYQQRWIQDRSQVKAIEKSRRIGISYAEAADATLYAAAHDGANVYYMSYDYDMTSGFIQDCAGWAKGYQIAASEIDEQVLKEGERSILTHAIAFDSGHKIQTFSSAPRNLRSKGRPGERLILDEAAFVDELGEVLKAAMAMTMWGGQVHIISTHNGVENPFNLLLNDIHAGRYDYSTHRVTLDDALEDGLYRRICEVTEQIWTADAERDWREQLVRRYRPNEDEELHCIPRLGGGVYLPRALVEPCMAQAPVVSFHGDALFNGLPEPNRAAHINDWIDDEIQPLLAELNRHHRHTLGMDFARSGDMSVIAPMEIGPTLKRRVPFLIEMHNVPHEQQKQVLLATGDALPRLSGVGIDAGGNGSWIAEAAHDHWGSVVEPTQFNESWYRDHLPRYKAAFEDHQITIPQSDDVLEDHRAVQLVRGVPRLPEGKTDKHKKRHGDSVIAIALAFVETLKDKGPVEFQSTGRRTTTHWFEGEAPWTLRGWGTVSGGTDFRGF